MIRRFSPTRSIAGLAQLRLEQAAAVVAAMVGLAVLTGWGLGIPALRSGLGTGTPVNPASGLLILMTAISLGLSGRDRSAWSRRLGITAAVGILLLAGSVLVGPLLGLPAGFDQIPFRARLAALGAEAPKPLHAGSALLFLMMAAGVLLVRLRGGWRLVGRSLGLFVALVGTLALVTYVYRSVSSSGSGAGGAGLGVLVGLLALSLGLTFAEEPLPELGSEEVPTNTLRGRVNLAFSVAVVILVLTGTIGVGSAVRSRNANRLQDQSSIRKTQVRDLLSLLQGAETGIQAYLLSGDSTSLGASRAALDSVPEMLRQTAELFTGEMDQAARFDTLQPLINQAAVRFMATINAEQPSRALEASGPVRWGEAGAIMREIRRRLSAMAAVESSVNAGLQARATREDRIALSTNLIAALLAVCFLTLAGFAVNQDFKHRARAEGERDRFFNLSLDMLCIANADGYFKRLNPAFTETLGWTIPEMLGRPFLEFVHPDDQAATLREVERQTIAGEPVLHFENRYRHKNGSWRVLSWRSVPQPGGFMFATARDVTDAHEAAAELRSAKEAAEAANRAKSDFLAKMSHELRTPLNSIIGFSEILEDGQVGPLNDKQRRYISNVLVSGRNLLQLINDILDLSKVEAGRMELVPTQFHAGAAIEQVGAIVAALADRKGLVLDFQIPALLPLLNADPAKFKQIMYNLLGNAVKFTPEGGRVTVSARVIQRPGNGTASEWVEIAVADTGIGIAPEHLTRIFKEFEQVHTDPLHTQQGTGLGLALTQKLVELHGGRVSVESEVGRGSVFRFTLPCAPSPTQLESLPASVSPSDRADSAAPLVLVIDNDPRACDLIAHYLTQAGYRVESTADGKEAIRLAQTLRPAAITLDILLPDRDGLLILAELKRTPSTRGIPVVVVSVTDQRELGFSLGAADWLVKPVSRDVLLQALEATTDGQRRTRRPRVLVVDDDPATVAHLSEVLTQYRFAVLTATGGREGIGIALSQHPDVIVLDLIMPEVNGFDVVQTLREHGRAQGIPILILTAADLTRADRERLGSSVQAIVSKGGPSQLLAELARVCPVSTSAAGAVS